MQGLAAERQFRNAVHYRGAGRGRAAIADHFFACEGNAGADIQADHTWGCLTALRRLAFLHELRRKRTPSFILELPLRTSPVKDTRYWWRLRAASPQCEKRLRRLRSDPPP
jgi:hypothetical protein